MNITKFENLRKIDTKEVSYSFTSAFRDQGLYDSELYIASVSAAYVFSIAQNQGYSDGFKLETFLNAEVEDEDLRLFLHEHLENNWNEVSRLYNKYSSATLQAYILFGEPQQSKENVTTPLAVVKIATRILDIQHEHAVADMCCGLGTFIREAYVSCPDANYYGNDISTVAIEIARIKATVLEGNICLRQQDIFDHTAIEQYDRVFCDPPFMNKVRDTKLFRSIIENNPRIADRFKTNSQGWLFGVIPLITLKRDGKAIILMPIGSTWNIQDADVRRYFIDNGDVEAVIELPEKIYDYTAISTVMIVLSHGNKSVRMINARNLCVRGRRTNEITDSNIDQILECYYSDSEISKSVSFEEIRTENFVLTPTRYLEKSIQLGETRPFGEVIKSITRGAPLKASDLDEMVSDEPTEMQYLMLGNIQNGVIDEKLPYLSSIDNRYAKYIVENSCLLLSKNGFPFKVAVAHVKPGRKLLANGNLFIIVLDEEQVDPYFIKAFLESEKGIATLKSIAVGSALPNISIDALKKMPIPNIDISKQKDISCKYQATLDEITVLKQQLEKAINALNHVFDTEET